MQAAHPLVPSRGRAQAPAVQGHAVRGTPPHPQVCLSRLLYQLPGQASQAPGLSRHKPTHHPLTAGPPPPQCPSSPHPCPTHIVPFDEALPLAQISLHLGGQQDRAEQRHGAKRPSLERLDRHTRAGAGGGRKEGRLEESQAGLTWHPPERSGSLDTLIAHGWQWPAGEPRALARGSSAF